METNNIDSIFKNVIDKNPEFYNKEAVESKERIWQQIQKPKKNRKNLFLIYSLSAACIALLILSSVLGITVWRAKRTSDYQAKTQNLFVENHAGSKEMISGDESKNFDTIIIRDTIVLIKNKIVYQPVEIAKNFVDTVYIPQIIYRDNVTVIENDIADETDVLSLPQTNKENMDYNKEIIISNNDPVKVKKDRKLRIFFGGSQNSVNTGTLALSAKF